MYNDHTNQRYCFSLGEIALLLVQWHTMDNRNTRNASGTFKHLLEQVNGGYMKHVNSFVELLANTASLERAGFAVTDTEIEALGEDLAAEDEFADFHGRSVMCISGRRQQRNLDLLKGFPTRLILLGQHAVIIGWGLPPTPDFAQVVFFFALIKDWRLEHQDEKYRKMYPSPARARN